MAVEQGIQIHISRISSIAGEINIRPRTGRPQVHRLKGDRFRAYHDYWTIPIRSGIDGPHQGS